MLGPYQAGPGQPRMGDFQFISTTRTMLVFYKKKSHSQQARDNLRQQEFKKKKLKEEIVDLEKTELILLKASMTT